MVKYPATFVLAALISCSIAANGQPSNAKADLTEADRLAMLYNWPRAIPLYLKAESEFQRAGDNDGELAARLGWIQAEAYQEPSEALADQVDKDLRNPMAQTNPGLMLRCLVAKGAVEEAVNENSSRTTWEQVQKLAELLTDDRWKARAQAELGEIDFLDGNVAAASRELKTALISMYVHGDFGGAIHYGSIVGNGLVEAGQPDRGIRYCEIAILLAAVSRNMGYPFMAYEGKARGLIALHRDAEARRVLNTAIREAQAQNAFPAEAQLLVVRGEQEAATDPTKAIHELQITADFCRRHGFLHVQAWATFELAMLYDAHRDFVHAAECAALAETQTEGVDDRYHLPEDLALMADVAAKAGHPKQADRLYSRAEDVTEGLLVSLPSRQIESSLIATLSNIYIDHFRLAAANLSNVSEAFEVIERARGRSIADQLRTGALSDPPKAGIEEALRRKQSQLQIELIHAGSSAERSRFLQGLVETDEAFVPEGEATTDLQKAALRGTPIALANIQRSLSASEAMLEYVLDGPQSFCLYITRHRAGVITLPAGREQIDKLVADYRKQVDTRTNAIPAAHSLYSDLITPIPLEVLKPRLIVIPDGKLNLIPFDALTDGNGQYVLATHVVTYAPSATVLSLIEHAKKRIRAPIMFLGVGGVQYGALAANAADDSAPDTRTPTSVLDAFNLRADPLPDLPGSRDEVTWASRVFGSSSVLLLGRSATEEQFLAEPLNLFRIIHIAAHAFASVQFPDQAAVLLGNDPAHRGDGLLRAWQIRQLRLNADLVTLSACDAGVGRLEGEEGIENIERAFLFAGARSVLATLWTASDVYTTDLMDQFYRDLAADQDEGDALRYAKLALIRRFRAQATPFYWAGFTLVGAASSPLETRKH